MKGLIVTITIAAVVFLIASDLRRPDKTAEEAQEHKARFGLEKALIICREIKQIFAEGRFNTSVDGENYRHLRDLCLDNLTYYTIRAFEEERQGHVCHGFVAAIDRETLEKSYLCRIHGHHYSIDRFAKLLRSFAKKSGRTHDPKYRDFCIYKLLVEILPVGNISGKEIAPLVDAVIRANVHKVAILVPLDEKE